MVTAISYTYFRRPSSPDFPIPGQTARNRRSYFVVFGRNWGHNGIFPENLGKTAKIPPLFSAFWPLPLTAPLLSSKMGRTASEWNITGALEAFPAVMRRKKPSRSLVPDPGNAGVGSVFDKRAVVVSLAYRIAPFALRYTFYGRNTI